MTRTTIMSRLGRSISGAADSYGRTEVGDFVRIFDNSALLGAGGIYTTAGDVEASHHASNPNPSSIEPGITTPGAAHDHSGM